MLEGGESVPPIYDRGFTAYSKYRWHCSILRIWPSVYTILLWLPPATRQELGTTATTGWLFLNTSWGLPTSTAGLYRAYDIGERGGSSRADGWSGWLLATPTTHRRPEPFGTRSRATAMASLPMFAMHVWSEPSHVVVVACFPECSRALASRCLAGCRSIQTTTASNYYIQLLALAPKARPLGLYFKNST